MASNSATNSRLAQIQMRFQQKQLQEREQRRMEMTVTRTKVTQDISSESSIISTNDANSAQSLNSSFGNGKVRQMFNERRRGVGIDRSNPLKPITTRSSPSSSTLGNVNVPSKNSDPPLVRKHVAPLKPVNGRLVKNINNNKTTTPKANLINNLVDENSRVHLKDNLNANNDSISSSTTLAEDQLDNNFKNSISPNEDRNNNNISKATPKPKASIGINLNPVQTKKTPPPSVAAAKLGPARHSPKATTSQTNASTIKKTPKMGTKWLPRAKTPPTLPPGTVACKICNRNFLEDRITKHEEICERTALKKRKIFDASKHRVKGTEAEKFLKKPARGQKVAAIVSTKNPSTTSNEAGKKNSNWRKKHEEFIAAIRAAKEVQLHLARGGKLSDLPPPPPSENPDYITCPHCSRRFNESAANRHIPKCANMLHNKPKPVAKKR